MSNGLVSWYAMTADRELDPRRVLVLDVRGRMLETHCRVLEASGLSPIGVSDIEEALAEVSEHLPAALVFDADAPGHGELELAERLRGRFGSAAPPMMLVTAAPQRLEPAQRALFDEVLMVPYVVDEFGRAVQRLARRHAERARAPSSTTLRRGIRLPKEDESDQR